MKTLKTLLLLTLAAGKIQAQQTIQQSIMLRSNGVNSTELMMYKLDNTNYNTIYSNSSGIGIYNSSTASSPWYINSSDNVGIGTTSPKEKLSVNGKIRAQEIKVETAGWPDYVFEESYKLPVLAETEKHIKEKGHLPGIPSAAEVKANGVELGEMSAKLLQKIEELTLYIIQQNKRQVEQDVKILAQQKEINQLKGLK
eukprot:gene10059-11734_t